MVERKLNVPLLVKAMPQMQRSWVSKEKLAGFYGHLNDRIVPFPSKYTRKKTVFIQYNKEIKRLNESW